METGGYTSVKFERNLTTGEANLDVQFTVRLCINKYSSNGVGELLSFTHQKCLCEGLSKISSNFILHLIKVGKLKRFKKVSTDLKAILKFMTDLSDLSFEKGGICQSILTMLCGKIAC